MRCASCVNTKCTTLAQEIKLSKIENFSTAIVRRAISFIDSIQTRLIYARVFREDQVVSSFNSRVLEKVNRILSCTFLAANCKATYARFIYVARMMTKNEDIFSALLNLAMCGSVVNTLEITHLDDPGRYTITKENIFFMIQTDDAFVNKYHTTDPFHADTFYRYTKTLLGELHVYHEERSEEKALTLDLFFRQRCNRNRTSPIK